MLALAVLSAGASATFAAQPLITDDTGTQGAGANQLEFSFTHERQSAAGETGRVHTLPAVATRGLSETIDLFAGLSYTRIRAGGAVESGYGNPMIGGKWRFYEEGETSLALKPEIIFPVSAGREAAGLGSGKTSAALSLILSQELPFGAVHVNAGVGRERFRQQLGTPDATTRRVSLAPVWALAEQWKLALDLGCEWERSGGRTVRARYAELAAIYAPGKDLELALGLLHQADNAQPKTATRSAIAGVTWRYE